MLKLVATELAAAANLLPVDRSMPKGLLNCCCFIFSCQWILGMVLGLVLAVFVCVDLVVDWNLLAYPHETWWTGVFQPGKHICGVHLYAQCRKWGESPTSTNTWQPQVWKHPFFYKLCSDLRQYRILLLFFFNWQLNFRGSGKAKRKKWRC